MYMHIYINTYLSYLFIYNQSHPHDGLRPVNQKSTCLTQSTLEPCVVKILSRHPPNLRQHPLDAARILCIRQLERFQSTEKNQKTTRHK